MEQMQRELEQVKRDKKRGELELRQIKRDKDRAEFELQRTRSEMGKMKGSLKVCLRPFSCTDV